MIKLIRRIMSMSAHRAVKQPAERAGEHEPLYITEHAVAHDFDFPAAFRVDALPGLMFCQIVDKGSEKERRVVAWWKSRETFAEAWSKQFAELLGTHATLCFEGFQLRHQLRRNPIPWLRPTAIVAGVGAVVALLTGLSTIEDYGYSWLGVPDCTLWADPLATAKPHRVGDAFGIQVQVKNRHLRASSVVTLKPVLKGDGLKLGDESAESPYPVQVQPGKAEVEEFRFVAARAGQHTIRFKGTEEAGTVHGPRKIPPFTVTIEVWDQIDLTPRLSLLKASPRAASVLVEVRNARRTPLGMVLEATLTNPGDVEVLPDKLTIKDADDPVSNAEFAQLRWRMPPSLEEMTLQTARLVLQGSGVQIRNKDDWNKLLTRLKVQADEPDELSSPVQTK
jgi:hypothetical protein